MARSEDRRRALVVGLGLLALLLAFLVVRRHGGETLPSATASSVGPVSVSSPTTPERGYHARPCGFDLDHDGVVGEPEDCRLCDGQTSDPDGDGVVEDLVYVDAGLPWVGDSGGSDSTGNGSPERPFRTLRHAFQSLDGPADDAEDIVCFRGIAREGDLPWPVAGVPGVVVQPRRGSEARDWQLPRDPARLVGWDFDRDGRYPPFDSDDVAVLDGGGDRRFGGHAFAFEIGDGDSYLELAHFTAKDFGRYFFPEEDPAGPPPGTPPGLGIVGDDADRSGFVRFGDGGGRAHHLLFHDLVLDDVNRERFGGGHRVVFYLFTRGTFLHHVAFVNLRIHDTSSFLVRGAGGHLPGIGLDGLDFGPLRWQRLTVTALGADEHCREGSCVTGFFSGFKLWSHVGGVEVLDSVFDSQIRRWSPTLEGGNAGAIFAHPTQCSRDWVIRNNTVRDFNIGLIVDGSHEPRFCGRAWRGHKDLDGNGRLAADELSRFNDCRYTEGVENPGCLLPTDPEVLSVPRPVEAIRFEDNDILNGYSWPSVTGARLRGGRDPETTVRDVTLARNRFVSRSGFAACVQAEIGNGTGANGGSLQLLDNVCWGRTTLSHGGSMVLGGFPEVAPFPIESVTLTGNRIVGLEAGEVALRLRYRPRDLRLGDNVYPRGASWVFGELRTDSLDDWRALVAGEYGSRLCDADDPCWSPADGALNAKP